MFTKDFYSVIDNELNALLEKYKEDELLKKYKDSAQKSSYALLIWFLEFYGRRSNYKDYITDGSNDSSCDIVFDNTNNQGERVFYIVQSKWNNKANSEKETDRSEILKALTEFDTLLQGEKKIVNVRLQKKLIELDSHLKNNGEVKFIFLSLSRYYGGANEDIKSFERKDEKRRCEVIDINRIKIDYIDRFYKGIEPVNPLVFHQNPEESQISLEIIQDNGKIKIEKPFEAYLFLLRPKTIYDLFDKYKFSLFYKNVRNPLLESQFNREIERTALENPAYFWYYNNGITAITYLLPTIGAKAKKIPLTGLQIINGAQTVYSIYHAYKNASPTARKKMDRDSLITLRLLESGGSDFDLNVTRYTNSQNPVDDRDFCANDDIQIRLQNESFNTNVWYEKRRGEFRDVPENIEVVSNEFFADAYLAYYLQDPVTTFKNNAYKQSVGKDLKFISYKDHKDGTYEKIFNEKTTFKNMLCAFYISNILKVAYKVSSYEDVINSDFFHCLALLKTVFEKYLRAKYGEEINITNHIVKIYEKHEIDTILKVHLFSSHFLFQRFIADNDEKSKEMIFDFLTKNFHYEKVKEELEKLDISVEDIESLVLEKAEE